MSPHHNEEKRVEGESARVEGERRDATAAGAEALSLAELCDYSTLFTLFSFRQP